MPDPELDSAPSEPLDPDPWPALAYWAARSHVMAGAAAAAEAAPPLTPFELPGPRQVVSVGLQLAQRSSQDLRRGSIYIGLLLLGALGPAIVYGLVVIGGLGVDLGDLFEAFATQGSQVLMANPQLITFLLVTEVLVGLGLILLIAISIDAQVIAIALLASRATERPLRLWEALIRARQVYWRLLGGGGIVNLLGIVLGFALGLVLGAAIRSQAAFQFLSDVITTVILVPFAYVSTGIVLGDVGVIESLRRSVRLFRARPSVGLVVVLFTLVTAAIEVFALGAGLDLLSRVGDFFHPDVAAGGAALIVPAILLFALVVAFGSLLFTISALVNAPQVAAFLGLTHYAAGLDRARVDGPKPPGVRWVTRPMIATLLALWLAGGVAVVGALGNGPVVLPAVSELERALRDAADEHGAVVSVVGQVISIEDPADDQVGIRVGVTDIRLAQYAWLDTVPGWLLDGAFRCALPNVNCAAREEQRDHYEFGALLVLERLADPPGDFRDGTVEFGPVFSVGSQTAPRLSTAEWALASHAVITRLGPEPGLRFMTYGSGTFRDTPSQARSVLRDRTLLTLIPLQELPDEPTGWDVWAHLDGAADGKASRDVIRFVEGGALQSWGEPATVYIDPFGTVEP